MGMAFHIEQTLDVKLCPHCNGIIESKTEKLELAYWNGRMFDETKHNTMEDASKDGKMILKYVGGGSLLHSISEPFVHYSGEEALEIIEKIKGITTKEFYNEVIELLKLPNTYFWYWD